MKKNYFAGDLRKRFRKFLHTPLVIVVFFLGSMHSMQAQKMERIPVEPVVCPATFENANSRMAMKQLTSKKFRATTKKAITAEIIVTFGPGAQGNAEVEAAFQFAIGIWAEEIVSNEPIRISADFANLGNGVLASAGPTTLISNFPGAPETDIFYPIALANSLAGEDLAPDLEFDLVVNIGNGIPWYFGTDGNTPSGQFDFVTVALHEMGHGLGFIDGGNVNNTTGVGNINGGGNPFVFDTFIVDGAGNSVLNIDNPSVELGDFLTSGDVFVNGPFAVAALGGTLPELFAPNPFQGGSSIAHWDEATFLAGDPNSLMTPQVAPSESNFDIGAITRGHFRDMGWVLAAQAPITVVPGSLTAELFVEESVFQELTITNISEDVVTVNVLSSGLEVVVGSISPVELTIPVGESATINVELTAVGVAKGQYEETIDLEVVGFDTFISVPISVRVLDGTEVPMIAVNPESFDEAVNQLQILTRDLTISNTGDEVLNYTITVNDEPQITFDSKVAATKAAISANGFTTERAATKSGPATIFDFVTVDGEVSKLVTSLYATDFEDFTAGELSGQGGWGSQPAGFWNITDTNPAEGAQHVRGTPDGSGTTGLAFSPLITPGNEPFMVASARLNLQGSDTSFEFIPQSNVVGSVNTRVRFNANGSVDVLDAGTSSFVPISATRPSGYFEIRVIVDKDDLGIRVFFDDELVFAGTGFAGQIDQLVLFSDNAGTTTTIDVDNVEVTDGDANAFFLTVSPSAGSVAEGSSTVAQVKFDARALEAGVYTATINVSSDDPENESIDIPVTLTVLVPPTITVVPDALSEAVDVTVDDPAVKTATFTVSNSGESPLDFTTSLGDTEFTASNTNMETLLANLDMSIYGVGNTTKGTYKSIEATRPSFSLSRVAGQLENATMFNDSIFYDSGINFPDSFGGLDNGTPIITAVKFDAETDFTLTAVRNAYTTEALTDVAIILEVYRGGTTPAEGELLLQQTTTTLSTDGIFLLEELMTPLNFTAGEHFWIVHSYPAGINFPQGQDADTSNERPDTYYFSSDGGVTYTNVTGFLFLKRALSGDTDGGPYLTLQPSSGSVAPGESVEVEVTFDGSSLSNGIFETDILVNSNDPITPTASVATTFEVSGQISGIAVSDELLLFNDVFVGNTKPNTFTITNTGLSQLNVTSIVSDNEDFTVEPASAAVSAGEELEVVVTFAPSSTGSINGIITINSDAANVSDPIEVIVNGIGVDPPIAFLDPQEVFESTDKGTTVDTEIVLRNDGNSPLTFSFPDFAVAALLADPDVQLNNTEIINFSNFSSTQEKGFADSRIGHPVEYSLGTDTKFGYTWIDSDEAGGPVYFPFDIRGIGTDISALVGADDTVELGLPTPIEYYGVTYESLFINANGFVSFQEPTTFATWVNTQIPVDDGINNVVAGFWADLEPQNGGSVHVAAFADAIVVQWSDAPIFFGAADELVTFKIILYTDGNIEVFYDDVDGASFTDEGTVGIENASGTDGAQVAFNTPYIKDGLAVRFVQPEVGFIDLISSVSPLSGVIPAGGSKTLTITLDATELEPGTYLDKLTVSSNAPDKLGSTSIIELEVLDIPEVVSFLLINADTDEAIGPLNDGDVIDLGTLTTSSFNVVANIGDVPAGSVVFDLNGEIGFRTESKAPYALAGDSNGAFNGLTFPLGTNTITATPYSGSNGTGTASTPLTVTFEVVAPPVMLGLTLVNATTNMPIGSIQDGDVLDLADFPESGLSVIAETNMDGIGSVIFGFNGVSSFRVENVAPYALAGDSRGNYYAANFPLGINTITATAYTGRRGSGTIAAEITINFEVIDSPVPTATAVGRISPNPVLEVAQFSMEDSGKQVLKGVIVNLSGQVVSPSFDVDINDQGNGFMDVSTLSQGIYILRLTDASGKVVSQIKMVKN